jgi:hypothetical protein
VRLEFLAEILTKVEEHVHLPVVRIPGLSVDWSRRGVGRYTRGRPVA